MNSLVLKLNAAGDVVRTTTLLQRLNGNVTWITAGANVPLLQGVAENVRCLAWEDRGRAADLRYELIINLEDERDVAAFATTVEHERLFGAYLDKDEALAYTDDSKSWFDLSLISRYGRTRADELKLQNRHTYQELIFGGLGWSFEGEKYLLPVVSDGPLSGDVAVSPVAGPVWPMKGWAYYDELRVRLKEAGLQVNVLPRRSTVLEHLADVQGHRCLVSGDSLPMHLALGAGVPCVTLFNCTSPWEIHDYGLQTKIVSPVLEKYFYKRGNEDAAVTAIRVAEVYDAVIATLNGYAMSPVLDNPADRR